MPQVTNLLAITVSEIFRRSKTLFLKKYTELRKESICFLFFVSFFLYKSNTHTLADPGGAHGARVPPLTAADLIFLCPKRLFFSFFYSLAINFKHNFNTNIAKTH